MSVGAVAAGHPSTAEAAMAILRAGGNAADACIAGALAACVAEPLLASLGGSGMLIVWPATGEPEVVDFFSSMPGIQNAPPEFHAIEIDFGSATQRFHVGRGSVAAPMTMPGLATAAAAFGTRSLLELTAPAIALAREGAPVSEQSAEVFRLLWPICARDPETAASYSTTGAPPQPGPGKPMPGMAHALSEFARERGTPHSLRTALLEQFGEHAGGSLLPIDLEAKPAILAPHRFELAGAAVCTSPRLGGRLIEVITDALVRSTEGDETLRIAEACRRGTLAKVDERAFGSTTHMSVVDAAGNAAACTLTNGEGCGHMLRGTQIQLNNFLGEEDLHPDGFFAHPAGRPLPSMIAPTIARTQDGVLSLGSGGSNRIRSVVSQVLWRVLAGGDALDDAIWRPRVHAEADAVWFEADPSTSAAVVERLSASFRRVYSFPTRAFYFGGVNAVQTTSHVREAVGDLRRGGVGLTE